MTNMTTASNKKSKDYDLASLPPIGLKILVDLTTYILENPDNNIFEEFVFSQHIKSKNKRMDVPIIDYKDFFKVFEAYGITLTPYSRAHKNQFDKAKQKVRELLWLDEKYGNLLVLKKINRIINQIDQDENLKEKAKYIDFEDDEEFDKKSRPRSIASSVKIKYREEDDDDDDDSHSQSYDEEFMDPIGEMDSPLRESVQKP